MPASPAPDVVSSGAVIFRPGKRVLLVHRPKYDDWSFPKGKLNRGEHPTAAAVREVAEETGLQVRLGAPLSSQRYPVARGHKTVHYWTGRPLGDHDVSGYVANAEIDDVRWVDAEDALTALTYDYDRDTLREALKVRRKTRTLVVLRHGKARSRKAWRSDDRERPLLQVGRAQAERLVPVLAAYGVVRVVSSGSTRCVETVAPYAASLGGDVETDDRLSEEDAKPKRVRKIVAGLLDDGRHTVLCTHRPVLPQVFDALGVEDPSLALGEMLVVHLRKGRVVATERHLVR
ncbi:NUDIX hydrolase [Nocardioides sp. cx-173]|uniref:NUDIX hydrolase n=1 Tax=Nocardioides sp. cx-173 TaxID=2898796 RepID=UPI001E29229A|nr:NUDIX hydrolase [Nocardioides sp. cx-173]MCD4526901.1 NUDIX hydrolase [Nocardioides sp. cx-173]UGB41310.1 NUDIX hydrolase [Nocardioides sp. cx-173]